MKKVVSKKADKKNEKKSGLMVCPSVRGYMTTKYAHKKK
jgi:hypothetical protein